MKMRLNDWLAPGAVVAEPDLVIGASIEHLAAEFEAVGNDMDQLVSIQSSLESYMDILSNGVGAGKGVDVVTAQAIGVGLESFNLGLAERVMVSQEAFGEETSRLAATQVSLEAVADTLRDVGKAALAALRKLFDILHELWVAMTGGAARAQARLAKIKSQINSVNGRPKQPTISLGGGNRLSIGREFVGTDSKAVDDIHDIAVYMYGEYPHSVANFTKDLCAAFGDAKITGFEKPQSRNERFGALVEDTLPAMVKKHFKPIKGAQKADPRKLPSNLRYVGAIQSPTLAGNFALVQASAGLGNSAKKEMHIRDLSARLNRALVIQFTRLETNEAPREIKYTVPSPVELKQMVNALDNVMGKVAQSKSNQNKYTESKAEIEKTIKKILDNTTTFAERMHAINNPGWSSATLNSMGNSLIGALQGAARMLTQPAGQFNGYVVSTCNAFMAVLEHNLRQYEGATGGSVGGSSNVDAANPRLTHQK